MSATDELRAELTKRGVEWKAPSSYDGSNRYDTVAGGYWFHEFDGKITIHGLTPVQAIAATLGSGTCKLVETEHEQEIADEFGKGTFSYWAYDCSECGYENAQYGRFCAGCGRKVVDE